MKAGARAMVGAVLMMVCCSDSNQEDNSSSYSNDEIPGARRHNKEFYLSAAAVFRDEDEYLLEWLEFHLCMGVEHFFLYNHHSKNEKIDELLGPYIRRGIVTLDDAVCDVHCQVPTYQRCMDDHGHRSRWMAFIDIDEFLMPSPPSQGQEQPGAFPLRAALTSYESHPAVLVNWLTFGSSNHTKNPPGLVLENYIWRAEEPSEVVKSIAQPDRVQVAGGHNHRYKNDEPAVNEKKQEVFFNHSSGEPPSVSRPASVDILRIHHYRTKSREHAFHRFERDSIFRLNDFDNEDIYPSTELSQMEWISK
ncbi:hypothetical protein GUITHDRAFT_99081 [Guillardia theta CCMP2712]|uniref:Glycosyltransferase family 92 protein n=1 Tax=Guillardia theta (strain CCMP2712) TaxID=905079 RepID=L1K3D6_GUITC|nr:hypothetical protein GUITHDRAFT_99081 [Guillardia theta CCMP2712]EKX55301.1 hypothetical protein GUITHDRAFT_99081 [Guillardia theta CCMP2712]|eukprot:XP_005842281.1 hypothetical protein GUITHDRAFT_99081 [Guillardia theta CCMP2712]